MMKVMALLLLQVLCMAAMDSKKDPCSNWEKFIGMSCKDLSDPILQRLLKMAFKYAYIHGGTLYEKMKRLEIDKNHYRIKNILNEYPKFNNSKYCILLQAQNEIESDIYYFKARTFRTTTVAAIEIVESKINSAYFDAKEIKDRDCDGYGSAINNFKKIVQDIASSGEQQEPAISAFMRFIS